MSLGLSITYFKSRVGLNIHFIGYNFDLIGQREIGVNISCCDNVSFCLTQIRQVFCSVTELKGTQIRIDLDQHVFFFIFMKFFSLSSQPAQFALWLTR